MVPIPLWGAIAAVVATVVERYEFGPIDDTLINVESSAVLLIGVRAGTIV